MAGTPGFASPRNLRASVDPVVALELIDQVRLDPEQHRNGVPGLPGHVGRLRASASSRLAHEWRQSYGRGTGSSPTARHAGAQRLTRQHCHSLLVHAVPKASERSGGRLARPSEVTHVVCQK
jgi:hypothetical protein